MRRDGLVQLFNDEARRLLALPDDALGARIDALGSPPLSVTRWPQAWPAPTRSI